MRKLFLLGLAGIFLSSCGGSMYHADPVGIGSDNAEMKLSPCACFLIPQDNMLTHG
ncbi:MAG: hypothetical protein JXR30_02335 [Alphaproteobacteria bacterium]|nr:hypothetical protein [Alphaproteobacteria bacterium]